MCVRKGGGSGGKGKARTGGVHESPVVVEGVTAQETDCGVIPSVRHVSLFPVAHGCRHPVLPGVEG